MSSKQEVLLNCTTNLLSPVEISPHRVSPAVQVVSEHKDGLQKDRIDRQESAKNIKALPSGIPVSGPPPTSIITLYAISAIRLLRMHSMMDLP